MTDTYQYNCFMDNKQWKATINGIYYDPQAKAIECEFIGRGSRLFAYVGMTRRGNWIIFPELDKGASLSRFSDLFWNTEKLSIILGNKTDATTVASGLKLLCPSLF